VVHRVSLEFRVHQETQEVWVRLDSPDRLEFLDRPVRLVALDLLEREEIRDPLDSPDSLVNVSFFCCRLIEIDLYVLRFLSHPLCSLVIIDAKYGFIERNAVLLCALQSSP